MDGDGLFSHSGPDCRKGQAARNQQIIGPAWQM
jgi:hypothetical protein